MMKVFVFPVWKWKTSNFFRKPRLIITHTVFKRRNIVETKSLLLHEPIRFGGITSPCWVDTVLWEMGWFSNRTGASVDDAARKSDWLDQGQRSKLGTGRLRLVLSAPFPVVNWPLVFWTNSREMPGGMGTLGIDWAIKQTIKLTITDEKIMFVFSFLIKIKHFISKWRIVQKPSFELSGQQLKIQL